MAKQRKDSVPQKMQARYDEIVALTDASYDKFDFLAYDTYNRTEHPRGIRRRFD